jgi:hypothetical protein
MRKLLSSKRHPCATGLKKTFESKKILAICPEFSNIAALRGPQGNCEALIKTENGGKR